MAYRKEPRAKGPTTASPVSFDTDAPGPKGLLTPPPSDALTLWLGPSGNLMIGVPPSEQGTFGHTVTLNATPEGLEGLLVLLKARALARHEKPRIGTPAVPTGAMLQALERALSAGQTVHKVTFRPGDESVFDEDDF